MSLLLGARQHNIPNNHHNGDPAPTSTSSADPPSPLTFPLIQALSRRRHRNHRNSNDSNDNNKTTTTHNPHTEMVQDLLDHFAAALKIARWVSGQYHQYRDYQVVRRKKNRRSSSTSQAQRRLRTSTTTPTTAAAAAAAAASSVTSPPPPASSSSSPPPIHWLLPLLQSPYPPEQMAALSIVGQGCEVTPNSLWILLQILHYLFVIQAQVGGRTTTNSRSTTTTQKKKKNRLVWLTLLQHILFLHEDCEEHHLEGEDDEDDEETAKLPQSQSSSLSSLGLAFLAQPGHLQWMAHEFLLAMQDLVLGATTPASAATTSAAAYVTAWANLWERLFLVSSSSSHKKTTKDTRTNHSSSSSSSDLNKARVQGLLWKTTTTTTTTMDGDEEESSSSSSSSSSPSALVLLLQALMWYRSKRHVFAAASSSSSTSSSLAHVGTILKQLVDPHHSMMMVTHHGKPPPPSVLETTTTTTATMSLSPPPKSSNRTRPTSQCRFLMDTFGDTATTTTSTTSTTSTATATGIMAPPPPPALRRTRRDSQEDDDEEEDNNPETFHHPHEDDEDDIMMMEEDHDEDTVLRLEAEQQEEDHENEEEGDDDDDDDDDDVHSMEIDPRGQEQEDHHPPEEQDNDDEDDEEEDDYEEQPEAVVQEVGNAPAAEPQESKDHHEEEFSMNEQEENEDLPPRLAAVAASAAAAVLERSLHSSNNHNDTTTTNLRPPQGDDEEIHSEDEGDDDGEGDEEDDIDYDQEDEDEEEGEHDILMHHHHNRHSHGMDVEDDEEDYHDVHEGFSQPSLMELQDAAAEDAPDASSPHRPLGSSGVSTSLLEARRKLYLKACLQVLASSSSSSSSDQAALPVTAEHDLMASILNIVRPPKKPVNAKIIMRRAPTQEDFFRGSLSRNPISLQQLKKNKEEEPTVRDLRQHIATDLQMGDSAEMLEILVANKIVHVDLKLRVVHQVVWKEYLMESQQGGGGGPGGGGASPGASALSQFLGSGRARSLISSRSGLSMIFNGAAGLGGPLGGLDNSSSGALITEETPLASLPPMIITYRLTGVDGEATEDTVTKLDDPEAPSETADPEQKERQLEREFGITRYITEGRGISFLLKHVERHIHDTLRKIRRDDVGNGENLTRNHFKVCKPYPGLTILSCSAKLASNRKLLLESRAPTILLRLLLAVLHALEDEGLSERNPTAKELQELIEILASDMLSSNVTVTEIREEAAEDASTLRLLLGAIETSSLSRPLRNVIAKLLPYLTYGQPALSKELASEFQRHFDETKLLDLPNDENEEVTEDILMATFIHTSIALPANDVCNSLRAELIQCGFIERIASFALEHFPNEPPSWSPALWSKGKASPTDENPNEQWRDYTSRSGLKTAFDMLIGLSKGHLPTQNVIGKFVSGQQERSLVEACHWLEATSDSSSARVTMKNLGLGAETLLDELASTAGSEVATEIKSLRSKTRTRKKEIAMERRNKALIGMGPYGASAASSKHKTGDLKRPADQIAGGPNMRGAAASLLGPVFGFFGNADTSVAASATAAAASNTTTTPTSNKRRKTSKAAKEAAAPAKPAWMIEMEGMEDETGLTCAVCQEGKTLQPSELLGLYAYVKKIHVSVGQCGGRNHIDGTALVSALPELPNSMSDSHAANEWYPTARAIGENLKESSRSSLSSLSSSRRDSYFTTTVSAGNAIHFGCHNRARQADRNHPKAPKSEWEGATLRNSRVNCNVIMPLVTSRSSEVPLVAVDVALTEHQTAISNLLGARPNSMLWNILHDVRFLLLRMAYGESLNSDCGGGSLLSNCQFLFHQLLMADMFEKDAQVDAPELSQHARHLSAGFLAASAIAHAPDYNQRNQSILHRGIADSATMASLTCILFHNTSQDFQSAASSSGDEDTDKPHPKRRWIMGRDYFLQGLLNCAGRRHALGVTTSGCGASSSSSRSSNRRPRSRSGGGSSDWDIVDDEDLAELAGIGSSSLLASSSSSSRHRSSAAAAAATASMEDFKDALRPMLVYFCMMDQLSNDLVLTKLDDATVVEDCATRLVDIITKATDEDSTSIRDLLRLARVNLSDDDILQELQRGMMAA